MADVRTVRVRPDAAAALESIYETIARRGLEALPPALASLVVERMGERVGGATRPLSRAILMEAALLHFQGLVEAPTGSDVR